MTILQLCLGHGSCINLRVLLQFNYHPPPSPFPLPPPSPPMVLNSVALLVRDNFIISKEENDKSVYYCEEGALFKKKLPFGSLKITLSKQKTLCLESRQKFYILLPWDLAQPFHVSINV